MKRLLVTLEDAEDGKIKRKRSSRKNPPVLVTNEDSNTLPPWNENADRDEDEDVESDKLVNKALRADILAKDVVEFERKLSRASLDLCVFSFLIAKHHC